MRRRAYVDWERVTEENIPESGKEYLVAEIYDKVAYQRFATWYNKGDVVKIERKRSNDFSTLSEEEKLMWTLFESNKDYIIPVSGFYQLVANSDDDDEDDSFADCRQMLIPAGFDVFFAEIPLPPEGYLSEEQDLKLLSASIKTNNEQIKEEKLEIINHEVKSNFLLDKTVNDMLHEKPLSSTEMVSVDCKNGSLTVSTLKMAETAVRAFALVNDVAKIIESEGGLDELKEKLWTNQMPGELKKAIKELVSKKASDGLCLEKYKTMYMHNLYSGGGFYYYRAQFTATKKYKKIAHTMIAAYTAHFVMVRLGRCCRLKQLNAPDMIMMNELRMLTNAIIEHEHVSKLTDTSEKFPTTFGIYEDGTEYEGDSILGNLEKVLKCEWEEEEEEKTEPEDEYYVTSSPNHAYQNGWYALWNPKLKCYYRADGENVSVYKTWDEADIIKNELNK